jgi:hypothetical protein
MFTVASSMYACWALALAFVRLALRLFLSAGGFEDPGAFLGLAIGIATWATLIHDLTDAVMGALGIIDMKAYESALNGPTFWKSLLWTLSLIYFVWMITRFAKGIRVEQRTSWFESAGLGLLAFLAMQDGPHVRSVLTVGAPTGRSRLAACPPRPVTFSHVSYRFYGIASGRGSAGARVRTGGA